MSRKLLVALSGGVDSAVTAYLMKKAGYDCTGVTMRLAGNRHCPQAEQDIEDAGCICEKLGIPFQVLDFTDDFEANVIEPFVRSYENGLTPNPCITCNKAMKFGKLMDWALANGFAGIATGHYARTGRDPRTGFFQLRRASDPAKDQSYFLYSLTQEILSRVLFPLGAYTKADSRRIAEENGLISARKKDSQDICFIPDGDYGKFISSYRNVRYPEGPFLDETGRTVGTHKGAINYTLGQRKGLGLSNPEPVYVFRKDMAANTVSVGPESLLFSSQMYVGSLNWTMIFPPASQFECSVKARSRAEAVPATVTVYGDTATVVFSAPQRALTPGQAAVFYAGEVVLGGGIITGAGK